MDLVSSGLQVPLATCYNASALFKHLNSSSVLGPKICFLNSQKCVCFESCSTLCDPMDDSPIGFSVHGIFQARVLFPTPFPIPGDSPGNNTGLGCPCLLQCMKVKSESEVT